MIIEYNRPDTLEQALLLLARPEPFSVPLAGGTALRRVSRPQAVVDLQSLGLDSFQHQGNFLQLGATLRLQSFLEALEAQSTNGAPVASDQALSVSLNQTLCQVIRREMAYNQRQAATVAGTLMSVGGRSPFATVFLALDAQLELMSAGKDSAVEPYLVGESVGLGDLLPFRVERLRGRLITLVTIPANGRDGALLRLAFADVARTPADRPIVCVAVAAWPSGRTRIALGGFGPAPILAFDGTEPDGGEAAARSAYSQTADAWASAEYREAMAGILTERCLQAIGDE